ncbi:MAG: class II aldolase/adducin family protein [Desulfobacterales bacterium]|nr:class II aldolase/adducin family protein [Desulfobacterales bacterium]
MELCRFSAKAYVRRLCGPFTGLLSVRLPHGDRVLITPAGASLGEIGPENLILLDLEENIIEKPAGVIAPADTPYVINSYKKRRDVFAIGHFHPPFATAYSITSSEIPLITAHSRRTLREILRVKCQTCPSRFEGLCLCMEGQRKSYAGVNILLLEDNGIVTLGKNLGEVLSFAGLVEETARIAWLSENLSIKPLSKPR